MGDGMRGEGVDDVFELQRLLWDLRHDASTRTAFGRSPEEVVDRYAVATRARAALLGTDVAALIGLGANPLLVLAAARAIGVSRDRYYEQLRSAARAERADA